MPSNVKRIGCLRRFGRCGQWCSCALGGRGAAIIVTASLALLQAQRIDFHPRMAQPWYAPSPKSLRLFSTTDHNVMLVLNNSLHKIHRALLCSKLRTHWTVARLFQQASSLWTQHRFCHRNETKSELLKLKLRYVSRCYKILQDMLASRVGTFVGFLFTRHSMPVV